MDDLINDIARNARYLDTFQGAILDIEKLLTTKVDESVAVSFHRLLYANVITSLETYLSDAFTNTVLGNRELIRRFVERTPSFHEAHIRVSELFKEMDGIENKAKEYLFHLSWHDLERVEQLYGGTLGVKFPADAADIVTAIGTRHDIVHRNGKKRDGSDVSVTVTEKDVRQLIDAVERFVRGIDKQLSEIRRMPG